MKKTAAVLLLFALVLSASVTSFAQGSRPARQPVILSDFVQFQNIRSYTEGQGVYIGWRTTLETGNLGFLVYRNSESGPVRVSPNIVGGFSTRSTIPTGYGDKYEFYDPEGIAGSSYFLECLSVAGRRMTTAAFTPKLTENFERDTGHPKAYFEQLAQNRNGDLQQRGMKLTKDLQRTVETATLPPDINAHRWVVAQPGAKIAIKTDGMYRVTRTELQNAGFNVNTNSTNWRLFMEGNEQAIIVGAGDQYIEFFGRGINTVESDTRMYYLIVDAATAGKRIDTRVLRNLGGHVLSNFYRATAVRSERTSYNSNIRNGDGENYFGTFIADAPVTVPNPGAPNYAPFNLTDIDFAAPYSTIRMRLQGLSTGAHNVRVAINGHEVGFVTGHGLDNFFADFTIPTSYLIDGPNFFELNTPVGSSDWVYFDTGTVEFPRRYIAEQNRAAFFTPGYRKADVGNFTTANVRVFDTTYDANTQLLINFPVVANGGTFTVQLPSDRAAVMYAVEDTALLQSPSVTFNTPSTLSTPTNAAEVIIISYSAPDYIAAAEAWANYRRSGAGGSFSVRVVDVADVYDEFNYGVPSANSMTGFLQYAHTNWLTVPRYVLLLGDGSYDARNYEGLGNWNLVPVKMVDLIFGESGSDEALADFDHNGIADIPIGRIPARSATNITTALGKVTGFETPAMQNMGRGVLCAADLPIGFDFEAMCLALADGLPGGTPFTLVRRGLPPPNPGNLPDPQAHANLMTGLNTGPYIANYAGHGSAGVWASSDFFTTTHVPSLANGSNQSIYTMLTCFNGYFIRPTQDSLAEALLKASNGGAVATWASTTETTPDLQLPMGERFFDQISLGAITRIGDLILDAKTFALPPQSDVGYSWSLLGDPALKVRQ